MLKIQRNISLKPFNTLGIEAIANTFIQVNNQRNIGELKQVFNKIPKPIYILGTGANTLFTDNFNGSVIHINTKGIQILEENDRDVLIEVQAGEIWDNIIEFCVRKSYYGIENLVAIPSTVGASAIQNIGAYGMEAKDTIYSVEYIDLQSFKQYKISNKECQFNYRDSIFKHHLKDKIIITSVIFKLSKEANYKLNYGSIKDELQKLNITNPSLREITDIIRNIRNSKLPNPKLIGNAGSFFKNPIISNKKLEQLKTKFPNIVAFKINEEKSKLAAAWLIDFAKLKGFQIGGAAIHENQALVIINKNNATAKDIVDLSNFIQQKVFEIFNVNLTPEVIFI